MHCEVFEEEDETTGTVGCPQQRSALLPDTTVTVSGDKAEASDAGTNAVRDDRGR